MDLPGNQLLSTGGISNKMAFQLAEGEILLQAGSTLGSVNERADRVDMSVSTIHMGMLTRRSLAS